MKNWLAIPVLISSITAQAQSGRISVQPEMGHPACFKRVYTDDELRSQPKQLVSSLYVIVERSKHDPEVDVDMHKAEVFGYRNGQLFTNREPLCEFKADGSSNCFVECDGGSFDLLPRNGHALFKVTEDYYFPLFLDGKNRSSARTRDTISLDANDRANRLFKLYPVPFSECATIKQKASRIRPASC